MKSIMSSERVCYVCGSPDVVEHHIFFGTANRTLSDKYGCTVYLCPPHHTGSEGVHFRKELDLKLKRLCQERWEEVNNGTHDDFRRVFGKNYL